MDTAWIQVFVLTLAECVAPAGKSVCQEREFELRFVSQADCESALEQLVKLKSESETVIIDPSKARCSPSAHRSEVFASLDAINERYGDEPGWKAPDPAEGAPDDERAAYEERLASLPECGEADGVAPCRIGPIIIEEASGEQVEVWRRN